MDGYEKGMEFNSINIFWCAYQYEPKVVLNPLQFSYNLYNSLSLPFYQFTFVAA